MEKDLGALLYEGKAKRIFKSIGNDQKVFVEFKNDATAFNALKKSSLEGKGFLNCQISAYLFELLEKNDIKTHYLGLAGDEWMFTELVEIIPLEVVIRNIATGSLCRETPIEKGKLLSPPLVDLYFKDDSLKDPLLTDSRLSLLQLITNSQRIELEKLIRKVNIILQNFFDSLDLILVDFKLEMGFNKSGELMVADEISPDTCRIWDKRTDDPMTRILDKDRFRQDLGLVVESYAEILRRIKDVSSKPRYYS
tara:strand:- start:165 stop:920 length:756 start_codon:yes stop_codon:yes gene_type:complete